MTFYGKLLQGILAVVVATTAASLFVAQRQSSESYGSLVDELFRNQSDAFEREYETRLELAAAEARRLAMSVRLFAALEEGDPEVYKIARDELRLGEFAFFRLLDAHGDIIEPPPDSGAGAFDVARVHGSLMPAGVATNGTANGSAKVQLGFVELTRQDKPSIAYQIMSAPVANFDTTVGTLILGQRVRQLDTRADPDSAGLHSALWIDGRLVGGDLPEALQAPLAAALQSTHPSPTNHPELRAASTNYRYDHFRLNAGSAYPPVDLVSAFPMDGFEAQQRSLTIRIASTGAIALVVATLIGLALSRQLARPIARSGRCDAGNPSGQLRPRAAAIVDA